MSTPTVMVEQPITTADLRQAALVTVTRGGRGHANVYHVAAAPARDDETGYATVPNAVLGDPDLSQGALRAYVMVAHHSNRQERCIRTIGRIASYVGACYKSGYNCLRELDEAGYLASVDADGHREEWPRRRVNGAPITAQKMRRIVPFSEGRGVLPRAAFAAGESVGYNGHHEGARHVARCAAVAAAKARGPPGTNR